MTDLREPNESVSGIEPAKTVRESNVWDFPGPIGSGWRLVRRVAAGDGWHPATDHLGGTEEYGTVDLDPSTALTSENTFSIPFASVYNGDDDDDDTFDEFLFATGDMSKWLVVDKSSVYGRYKAELRPILRSHKNPNQPHEVVWYNRAENPEDLWISAVDHSEAIGSGEILYGEGTADARIDQFYVS